MRLEVFPDGGTLFLDTNIFLLECWDRSPGCSRLIERIELGLVQGVTSTIILSEVAHRLLIAEAITHRPTITTHPIRYLKTHPAFVRRLTETPRILERLTRLPLRVIALTPALWHDATRLTHRSGLLMHDATTVACLRRLRLRHLASADRDFVRARLPHLTVWTP